MLPSMIVNFSKGFVFIHIPKTGGSSIAATLKKDVPDNQQRLHRFCSRLGFSGFRKHLAVARNTKHETYQQFIDQFEQRTGLPQSVALALRPVAFVRHPVSRFISLHRYLLAKCRESYPEVPSDINAWRAVVQEGTAPYLAGIRSLKAQSSFVQGTEVRYFLGKFEALDEDVKRLGAVIGADLNLRHLNQSARRPASKNDWLDLSETTMVFLQEAYAEDFRNFGYSTD